MGEIYWIRLTAALTAIAICSWLYIRVIRHAAEARERQINGELAAGFETLRQLARTWLLASIAGAASALWHPPGLDHAIVTIGQVVGTWLAFQMLSRRRRAARLGGMR